MDDEQTQVRETFALVSRVERAAARTDRWALITGIVVVLGGVGLAVLTDDVPSTLVSALGGALIGMSIVHMRHRRRSYADLKATYEQMEREWTQ